MHRVPTFVDLCSFWVLQIYASRSREICHQNGIWCLRSILYSNASLPHTCDIEIDLDLRHLFIRLQTLCIYNMYKYVSPVINNVNDMSECDHYFTFVSVYRISRARNCQFQTIICIIYVRKFCWALRKV